MSGDTDREQQTEAPTEKKLRQAAEKGQVAISAEVRHAAMLGGAYLVLLALAGQAAASLTGTLAGLLDAAGQWDLSGGATPFLWALIGELALAIAPIFLALLVFAVLGGLVQGRLVFSWHRVAPKWSKLSPISGFQRLFHPIEFLKTLAKFWVALAIVGVTLWPSLVALERTMNLPSADALSFAAGLIARLVGAVLVLMVMIAGLDLLQQRFAFLKRMRMTKQEVKEEHKDTEGSPEIKGRIRQIQRERARHRMIQAVPKATVVVTNPTHYAVALAYDEQLGAAPRVVAKGVDALAMRIRAIATEAGVPIVENVPLARALYAQVDIDRVIPPEHYVAVAQVISFVMRLRQQAR